MNRESIFILGRQPAIGRAELESLLGSSHVEPIGEIAMASDIPVDQITFDRLGGTLRLAKPLGILSTTNWSDIATYVMKQLPLLLDYMPAEGKVKLGISVFGIDVEPSRLFSLGIRLKKAAQAQGRSSIRVIPNPEQALNSAQVLHNQLTGDLGIELLLIKDRNQLQLARTIVIQDIDAYADRDQRRPKRDAFIGMLPPKLAQILVNLATASLVPESNTIILDPFCGTGVVLQEALLMGYGAYGTDIEPRMIDYTRINLEWLATHSNHASDPMLEIGDATNYQWQSKFSTVASETYLGHPLSSWPAPEKLHDIIGTCNVIIQKFLVNLAKQIPKDTRLCLGIPAWVAPDGHIHHLPLLDQIEILGYNRISFSWATKQEMVYYRPNQLVGRELLVITRK